jgi:hypothetical protein
MNRYNEKPSIQKIPFVILGIRDWFQFSLTIIFRIIEVVSKNINEPGKDPAFLCQ